MSLNWARLNHKHKGLSRKHISRNAKPMVTLDHCPSNSCNSPVKFTSTVAMDCEFVGVGREGKRNALARVSIVNFNGKLLYDKFVCPLEPVTDYRTKYSGVRKGDLEGEGIVSLKTAQIEVASLVKNKVLVGHHISNDLTVLMLNHPKRNIRDTSDFTLYRAANGFRRSLKELSKQFLTRTVQEGEHCSVEDARATLDLYKLHLKQMDSASKKKGPKVRHFVRK